MVRQVLQRAGADVLERLGLHRGDGPPPPSPQTALDAVFRMPSGGPETEEQQREREKAEEAHSASNPSGRHVRLRMSEIRVDAHRGRQVGVGLRRLPAGLSAGGCWCAGSAGCSCRATAGAAKPGGGTIGIEGSGRCGRDGDRRARLSEQCEHQSYARRWVQRSACTRRRRQR